VAWLGGAAFVASLAFAGYFYAVTLGNDSPSAPASLPAALAINTALLTLFATHHSLFARDWAKRWMTRVVPPGLERSVYVWVASVLFVGVCLLWQQTGGLVYRATGALRWLLFALQLAGLYILVRGAAVLDPLELAGIRQAQQRTPVAFRTDGPYGLVRHPIYLGWALMTLAVPTMTVGRLMFAGLTTLYLILAIPWEEKSLVAAFGGRYRAYQSTVKWRLLPRVW